MTTAGPNLMLGTTCISSFVGLVAASTVIVACYMGLFTKQRTVEQYFCGEKRMPFLPIAVSFVGSAVSSITLLDVPVAVYLHGLQYLDTLVSFYIAIAILIFFILPKIYDQQFNSLFEFFEERYGKNTRAVICVVFILKTVLYLPLVIALVATRFSQVAALPSHSMILTLCVVCIFYTTIGGFKGVVWSQVFQILFMTAGLLFVAFVCCYDYGGFDKVLEVADIGGRLELYDIEPNGQNAFWMTIIDMSISWLYFLGANPGSYQKLISVPKKESAVKALIWFGTGLTFVTLLIVFLGLTMYAEFSSCDPLTIKSTSKGLLMLYYMEKKSEVFPGLEALFFGCTLCAAFSFMSSNLNTVAGIIYEDLVKKHWPRKLKKDRAATHIKWITVLVGEVITLISLCCNGLDPVLSQLFFSAQKFTDGVIVTIFLIGLVGSRRTSKTTNILFVSAMATFWIVYNYSWGVLLDGTNFEDKRMSTVGCFENMNESRIYLNTTQKDARLPLLHEESIRTQATAHIPLLGQQAFYRYGTIGVVITVIASLIWGDLVYGVHQGQHMGDIIDDVSLPISELKRRKTTWVQVSELLAKKSSAQEEKEMTRNLKEIATVHNHKSAKGPETNFNRKYFCSY